MSVKLIIVALLATSITTVSAERGKIVTTRSCSSNAECKCADPEVTRYPVGQCLKRGDVYYKVENCTVGEDVTMKSFEADNPNCVTGKWVFSGSCAPIEYGSARCDGDTITLLSGCPTDQCNMAECTMLTTIAKDDTTTCVAWGVNFYKLSATVNCADTASGIAFKEYSNPDCTLQEDEEEKAVTIKKECTANAYGQGTCKPSSEDKVSIEVCTDESCSACSSAVEVPFKKPTVSDGTTLYIEGCDAGAKFTVLHYRAYTLKKDCQTVDGGSSIATCAYMTVTATATIPTTTTETTTTTTTTETTTAETTTSDTSSTGTSDNASGSDNDTSGNDTSLAPARSVGVLALVVVVCLLASVY